MQCVFTVFTLYEKRAIVLNVIQKLYRQQTTRMGNKQIRVSALADKF